MNLGATGTCDVLVVDDDEDARDLCALLLEGYGYHVLTAGSADEALRGALAMQPPPRLLLIDLVMPGMTVPALLDKLRASPHLAGVPVVLVSGAPDLPVRAAELGSTGYLTKPASPRVLVETVQRHAGPSLSAR